MLGLEVVVAIGAALVLSGLLARRVPVAPALLLLGFGVLLGFSTELRRAELPPEVVLLLFLPVLLFWESLTTSLREIRSNLRAVVLASTGLVVATAGGVATVAHLLGMPWGPAWVLGGALAPTDATAVGVLARALPRRFVTMLRAESLVNDGTALVIYGLAVGVTVGSEQLGALHVSWLLVLSVGGGVLAGVLTAQLSGPLRRRLDDPVLANIALLLTPFTAFLLAELVHASGVLAVVVCGLMISQAAPRLSGAGGGAAARQQMTAFWGLATTVISSGLFVLVGLQAQTAARQLTSTPVLTAVGYVVAVTATVVGVRWAWLYTTPYVIRALDRRPAQRLRRVSARQRTVNAVAGFRGAVSLAAALAVPQQLADGSPFPDRDLIVLVTAGVIVLTLLQALVLPGVVRWARLPDDDAVTQERRLAETRTAEAAAAAVDGLAAELGSAPHVVERVHRELAKHRRLLDADPLADDPALAHHDQYTALRLALLGHQRTTLVGLRDEQLIDDIVLRQVQATLDVEEVRLTRTTTAE
ncbi:Na+/H+ antiporter [Rhodococcus aerolatus]